MRAGEYSIYIVRCNDGTLYTGIATDVERRIEEHQAGPRGAKYLRGKGPLRLEFSEMIGDRSTAQQCEYRVKRLERERKEALIAGQCSLADITSD
jgi:putative endonuclease